MSTEWAYIGLRRLIPGLLSRILDNVFGLSYRRAMYGKIYESLFTGSLVGAGAEVFAVMAYVIANQKPDRELGSYVELNPVLLATILGESQESVEAAITKLCAPDPNTTTPGKSGKRLIKVSSFGYQVVNGAKYRAIRDEEDRRAQNRAAQQRFRAKHRTKADVQADAESRERRFVKADDIGDQPACDRIAAEGLA